MIILKFLKTVTCSALALTLMTGVSSAAFLDVDSNTEVGKAIESLTSRGVIAGYGNGLFCPEKSLTRAEAVKIINKIFGYTLGGNINNFTDVKKDDWFYSDVAAAVNAGYIEGFADGTFRPNDTLTKEQVCVMLDKIMNFVKLPGDVKVTDAVSDWAWASVEKLLSNHLAETDGNGNFHATEMFSRGDFSLLLSQFALQNLPEIKPFDITEVAREELEARLSRIITAVREVLNKKTDNPEILAVFNAIADNMEAYKNDPSYDYKTGAKNTKTMYYKLPSDLRDEAKNLLVNFFTDSKYFDDIQVLYEFFF